MNPFYITYRTFSFHSLVGGGSDHMWNMMSKVWVFTYIMAQMKVNNALRIYHPRMNKNEILTTFRNHHRRLDQVDVNYIYHKMIEIREKN